MHIMIMRGEEIKENIMKEEEKRLNQSLSLFQQHFCDFNGLIKG